MDKFKPGDRVKIIKASIFKENLNKITTILYRKDCEGEEAYVIDLPDKRHPINHLMCCANWKLATHLALVDEDPDEQSMDVSLAITLINRIKENSKPIHI